MRWCNIRGFDPCGEQSVIPYTSIFRGCNFTAFGDSPISRWDVLASQEKFDEHCSLPAQPQAADSVGDQLANIAEHLAAKEPNVSLRSW